MLRLALIGHGAWGQKIARTLQSFENIDVRVIAKEEDAGETDGVVVATPSATHAAVALPYIERGVPTFIEKPLATSVADAERIAAAARASKSLVFVGHLYVHHPGFVAFYSALPRIGRIKSIVCEGMNGSPRSDSSVLWDWLPHHLSMAHVIMERAPTSVAAQRTDKQNGELPAAATVVYQFDTVPLQCTVSWTAREKHMNMVVSGEAGTLVFDDTLEEKVSITLAGGVRQVIPAIMEPPLPRELRAFVDAVKVRAAHDESLDLGVAIVREIAAGEESIRRGESIEIES